MPAHTHKENRNTGASFAVAIVGMGALFPGSENVDGFWHDIISGRDCITDVPETHWLPEDHYHADPATPDKTYCKRGAFLLPIAFDPLEFRIPPANLPSTDTSQLLGLKIAKQVMEDIVPEALARVDRKRIGVILGVGAGLELLGEMNGRIQRPIWAKTLAESGIPDDQIGPICDRISAKYSPWTESTFPGLLVNVVAGRIAQYFDLGGTNCTVDAACASSFSAMSMAVNELRLGMADLVITGGVDTTNGPFLYTGFSKTPALSPTGDCRPFSDASDGTVLGEGIGMVALKRLEDAQRDGDRIYAVIRGLGTSSDGSGQSIFAPLQKGQELALRRCYEMTGYTPDTVGLLEAHGTGTATGDRVEFDALSKVFMGQAGKKRQWCALGSIKSQIGHTKSAAGIAGLIKAALALNNAILPPTIKVDRPNSGLDLARSPFHINTTPRPWITDGNQPRRASVSAFGFGGTNYHVALEAYGGSRRLAGKQRSWPSELILLGGKNPSALAAQCREMAETCSITGMLPYLAQLHQKAFDPASPAKLAIVAEDEADLARKLEQAIAFVTDTAAATDAAPPGIHCCLTQVHAGDLAFVFPGQGSQYLGMGADLAMHMDASRDVWNLIAAHPFKDDTLLHDIVFPAPAFDRREHQAHEAMLNRPQWALPAVCATSLSTLTVLNRLGIIPDCVGGHGSGEITAWCAAGMTTLIDTLKLARKRGEHVPAPSTVHVDQMDLPNAEEKAGARRVFLKYLDTLKLSSPDRPIFPPTGANAYPMNGKKIRRILESQFDQPASFEETIEAMYAAGARIFVAVGPGSRLTDLIGRTLGRRPHLAVSTDRDGRHGITSLWHTLGRLAIHGVPINFSPLWEDYTPVKDPRSNPRPKHCVLLRGCNYAKPYPPPATDKRPAGRKAAPSVEIASQPISCESVKMENDVMTSKPGNQSDSSFSTADSAFGTAAGESEQISSVANTADFSSSDLTLAERDFTKQENRSDMTAWVSAFQELQRQTAEAHAAFQKSLTESHLAYLKAAEASTQALRDMLADDHPHPFQSAAAPRANRTGQTAPPSFSSLQAQAPPPAPAEAARRGRPEAVQTAEPLAAAVDSAAVDKPDPPEDVSVVRKDQAAIEHDLEALLFDVVAEKTGYPEEVLKMEMELETDLGIDSIKRVEILAAVNERVPQMPEVDTAQLAELQTMEDVFAYMQQVTGKPDEKAPQDRQTRPVATRLHTPAPQRPGRYALRTVPAPHNGHSVPRRLPSGFCAVTDDGDGIAHALAQHLKANGIDAGVVKNVPDNAASVVFLGGLMKCKDPAAAMGVNRKAFSAAHQVSKKFTDTGGFFATVQDTGGNFGLGGVDEVGAWLGGLPGLIKTAAVEWPGSAVKAIDVERSGRSKEDLVRAISRELLTDSPEIEVGLGADGSRVRLESYPIPLEHRYPRVDENSVIVVSGGAKGVTAASLVQLAQRFRPKIALLGRTALETEPACCAEIHTKQEMVTALVNDATFKGFPIDHARIDQASRNILSARRIRSTLEALDAAGSMACYLTADIRDPSAVDKALKTVRRKWGPVTGIIHGAGIINDKSIAEKKQDTFDSVFNTKVQGLHALISATAQDPLELICLFSSVAARLGNAGQCDYAMANEVLNKVAHTLAFRRSVKGCVVKSINWGPWEGGMVSRELRAHFEQSGIPLIPLETGARLFVDEIQAAPSDPVEITIIQDLKNLEQRARENRS